MNYWINRFYGPRVHFDENATGTGTVTPPATTSTEAPASTPSPTETPSLSSDDAFSGFDSVDDGLDEIDLPTVSDPVVVTPDTPVVAPVVPPAAPVAPVVPPVAAPVVAPSAKDGSPPSPIEAALTGMVANEPALVAHLAQTTYALSKEEMDAFELDAVGQIPKLMAKVHMQATKNTLSLIRQMVPQLIDSRTEQTGSVKARAAEAKNEFYTTNSDLNEKDHGPLLDKWASAFRAQNPRATRQEAIKFVGQAIRTELGLPAPAAGAAPTARPQPFAPARPGAKAPVSATRVDDNPFGGLGMDIEE